MESAGDAAHDVRVARLVITWSRPRHVDALAWARQELVPLVQAPEVRTISLARVRPASSHSRDCEWLCEVFLNDGADGAACVDRPEFADWIRDLHLLGLHPRVALVDDGETVAE
jgi:hypothetical protein